MCYSANASLVVGAGLVACGVASTVLAVRRDRRLIVIGLAPLGFGIQQLCEGLVWLGLDRGATTLTDSAARVYLVFALGVWPLWSSISAISLSKDVATTRLLVCLAVLNSLWFWLWAWPLVALGRETGAHVVGHSIRYDYADAWDEPGLVLAVRLLYVVSATVPMLIVHDRRIHTTSMVALAVLTAGISLWLLDAVFTSVWCFGAAILSCYVLCALATLPKGSGGGVAAEGRLP